MSTIHVQRRISAPIDRAFAVYTDQEGWSDWVGLRVSLEREGREQRNGVGAIRKIHAPPVPIREEVLVLEAPHRFEYTLLSGAPVKNHRGVVTFAEDGAGCVVDWTVTFDSSVPGIGWLVAGILRPALAMILGRFEARCAATS